MGFIARKGLYVLRKFSNDAMMPGKAFKTQWRTWQYCRRQRGLPRSINCSLWSVANASDWVI